MAQTPVALLFTDLVHSTELLHRVGDERAQGVLGAHRQLLRNALAGHGGGEVKWLGDGLMTIFPSVADAVRCAVTMQQQARRPTAGERLGLRVGVHVGEALADEGDYVGTPVVLARRLCEQATAGQVLCSGVVVELLRGRQAFQFAAVGPLGLKGFPEPVPAYEVAYEPEDAGARLRQTPFTGRTADLARLGHRLAEARAGRGGVVMLMGEPGIGKTRMLEEFAEQVRAQGTLVLWGRCYEGEAGRPYGPFAEAIAEYARTAAAEVLQADLGLGAAPLGRLVRAVREKLPDLAEPVALEPYEERVRLLDAVTQFLLALATRVPTVLVLDDLHWADHGTVALLRHVARFASQGRLVVLGAYRDVEVDRQHPLADALGTLPRETRYEHVGLTGLDRTAVQALLESIAEAEVAPALAEALARETSGNPFFIREVLLHLLEEGALARDGRRWSAAPNLAAKRIPETVRHVIERRLGRLSEPTNRLLRAAAGFTSGVPFEVARCVAGLDEGPALDALDEALRTQLLVATSEAQTYDFSHALVRHTLYDMLSPSRQVRLHRQIAEAMEAVYGERAVDHAAEIAEHYHRSRDLPGAERGADLCITATGRAQAMFAYEDVAALLGMALALLPGDDPRVPRLLARRGMALTWGLAFDEACAICLQASERIAGTEGRDSAADYLADAVVAMHDAGGYSSGFVLARRGLELAGVRRDQTWALLASVDVIRRETEDPSNCGIPLDSPERREVARVLAGCGREDPWSPWGWSTAPAPGRAGRGMFHGQFWTLGSRFTNEDVASRAELLARGASPAVYAVGAFREGLPVWRDIAHAREGEGRVGAALVAWSCVGRFNTALGHFGEAEAALDRASALAKRLGRSSADSAALVAAEDELRMARDVDWDQPLARAGPGMGKATAVAFYRATTWGGIARTHARMGRVEKALHRLESVVPAIERAPAWWDNYVRLCCDAAETLWLIRETRHATTIADNILAKVVEPDFRYPMCDGRLAMGRLRALEDRHDEASEWFARARTVLDEQGARPLRAIADFDEGWMYLRRDAPGDRERAAPLLDAALRQFRELGMPGWIRRAETLRSSCEGAGVAAQAARTPSVAGNDHARMLLQRDEPGDREKAQPETRYAKSGALSIAYQVLGEGPRDLVFVPGIVSHVESFHELPGYSRFIERLASFARVITFDKRGTGLSDRVADAPTYEQRMDDILAVMNAAGSERAALFGFSEGGPLGAMFAASHPDRTLALVTFGAFARLTWAPDYPIGMDREILGQGVEAVVESWGTGTSLELFSASRAQDKEAQTLWAKVERLSASPGGMRSLMRLIQEVDVRCVLPTVKVPTLVLHAEGDFFPLEISKYFAERIRGARWVELKGVDHYPWFGSVDSLVAEIEEFLTGARHEPDVDRILATLLFTDIVSSTARAAEMGDQRWRDLLASHHALVRRELARFRGREVKTVGDGFLATFDGPARAIRCACAIRDGVRPLGIEIRAGMHTGECELIGDDVGGIAVHIGARVAASATPGEVLVSSTVKDLVAGSGLRFADRGTHDLPGVPGEWRLFGVEGLSGGRTAHYLEMTSLAGTATSLRAGETPSGPAPPGRGTASDGGGAPRTGDGAPVGGNVFRKEGDFWTIAYEDVVFRLKDSKGLHYMAHLLRHPGTEFHANDLVGAAAGPRAGAPSNEERGPSRQELAAEGLVVSRLGGAPALLDARAKAAYQERLSDLREELADAERLHDLGRAEHAGAEIDFLTTELTAPFRGHQKANPYAERARLTVTKGIKAALERISQNHPALGRHLAVTIRRGTFCAYTPDPRHPIPWTF